MEKCNNCGSDDLMEFSDCKKCQRCGAKIYEDGAVEYEPERHEQNIRHYDNAHDDDGGHHYRH